MISTIPPLWRDADAYVQLTQDPRVATFWGHAPAYCYLAKIPLFLGEQWERIRGQPATPRILKSQPALTDSGIWLLIAAQHVGLALAVLRFITTLSRRFWIRLALVFLWASNALFYTFAQCLGSETLGMILIVFLAAETVRLLQQPVEPAWNDWFIVAVLLLLCLLSRELNLGLIATLPLAFLVSWIGTRKSKSRHDLQNAVIAIALSITCVVLADSVKQSLARKTRLHPHSRIGFTFLWRLQFLEDLSPESRTAFMERMKAGTESEPVRYLIGLLDQMHAEHADLSDPRPLLERAIPYFGGSFHWEDLDRALNQMAFTFLWPPSPELCRAVRTDFVVGLKTAPTVISEYLFRTTAFNFQHKADMPACAALVTFRDQANESRLIQFPFQHGYFQLGKHINYLSAFVIWCGALIAFVIAAKRRAVLAAPTLGLAIALAATGLLLFAASCLLHAFEPRFALSMWELLLLSLLLLLAATTELLLFNEGAEVRRAAVRSEP